MVTFPELYRGDTLELPVIGVVSAVAGGLLLPISWTLAGIALVPCGLWLLYSAWLGILNARLRYRWSRQFPRRLHWRQLRAMLERDPARFIVYVRYFGGFDRTPLRPAAVVQDRATGEFAAIYPASWHVPRLCEQFGVQLVRK